MENRYTAPSPPLLSLLCVPCECVYVGCRAIYSQSFWMSWIPFACYSYGRMICSRLSHHTHCAPCWGTVSRTTKIHVHSF